MKLAIASILLAACASSPTTNGGGDDDSGSTNPWGDGTQDNPVPQAPDKGPYAVGSKVDLTVEAILPQQAEAVVAALREFSTNPAHALITLADEAGVPAVGTLYNVIPGVIKDKLEGWIDDEINKVKIAGKPITAYAGDLAGLADTALSNFKLDSTFLLAPNQATHTLTMLDLSPTGFDIKVPIGGLAADILTQTPDVTLNEGGNLAIGDEHFGLNYGEYAWQGINAIVKAQLGANIHDTLSNAINCPNLAKIVSDKCVLGVCVGHESELQSVCQGGVDALVNTVHKKFSDLRFDVFHFASGETRLVDDDGDGVADRMVDGTWEAELNLGLGLRHTPATFAGSR
ncbi:MAG TPA: hypothetical protein VGC41_16530 [Kofleriaceae bacterium]